MPERRRHPARWLVALGVGAGSCAIPAAAAAAGHAPWAVVMPGALGLLLWYPLDRLLLALTDMPLRTDHELP
jgi:hypothetical protein